MTTTRDSTLGDPAWRVAHAIAAFITALGRTAAEPAALDIGRGLRTMTDAQLHVRLADLEAELELREASKPVNGRDVLSC